MLLACRVEVSRQAEVEGEIGEISLRERPKATYCSRAEKEHQWSPVDVIFPLVA